MKSIGYQWLVEKFDLNVCDLLTKSYCISESRMKEVEEDGVRKLYYPMRRISVNDTWQGNLVFAIKNEGVNLEVLNAKQAVVVAVKLTRAARAAAEAK